MSDLEVEREPVYLDTAGVAARIGVKYASVSEYARRGDMPAPDLVFLGHRLWLVETIDQWRKQRYMRRNKRPMLRRKVVHPTAIPKLHAGARPGAKIPKGVKDKRNRRKSSSVGALQKPVRSTVDELLAKEIAADLRGQGFYCTTADVMVLADADTDGLEHERKVLQQRITRLLRTRRPAH